MGLNKNDLAKAMADGAASCAEGGAESMKALGAALENYLISNTDANYSWTGKMTSKPYTPDATVSFKAELEKSGATFNSKPENFNEFIKDLSDFLKKIKIKAPSGFSLSPDNLNNGSGTFTASQLGSLPNPKDAPSAIAAAFGEIAEGIINGWVSYFATAASGMHSGVYNGTAAFIGVQ